MTRMEETEALRARTDVHYNCCQSVLVPFADLCGLDKETAFKLGANFGSGMRHGSTCGAVTGALMVLGLAGKGADEATALMRRFREKNQVLDCANLLRLAKERGEERKCHCDRMVYEAVELLEERSRPLKAPVLGDMSRTIHESLSAVVRYRFWEGDRLLFDHTDSRSSFEYAAERSHSCRTD